MQGADHIASRLKSCCLNAMVILRILNILEGLKITPHPKIRVSLINPYSKLSNITRPPVWETAVHLAVAGGVFDGVFCAVLFPTRCLG